MKMDEIYFKNKYAGIGTAILNGAERNDVIQIIKQIARDAAEGQRINCSAACALRMKGRVDANCKCGEIYCTAKLEIPHA